MKITWGLRTAIAALVPLIVVAGAATARAVGTDNVYAETVQAVSGCAPDGTVDVTYQLHAGWGNVPLEGAATDTYAFTGTYTLPGVTFGQVLAATFVVSGQPLPTVQTSSTGFVISGTGFLAHSVTFTLHVPATSPVDAVTHTLAAHAVSGNSPYDPPAPTVPVTQLAGCGDPAAALPEAPVAVGLPLVAIAGGLVVVRRRRYRV